MSRRCGPWIAQLAVTLTLAACGPASDESGAPLEQGRTYTDWLYDEQYDKLWERFSPDMKRTFGTVGELKAFAGRAVRRLGAERGAAEERVAASEPFYVYTRTVSFDSSPDPMLIQWTLARDGQVTGFVVRPVPESAR